MNIHVESLKIEYEGKQVLSIPSADFAAGTVTAIVGPNGAGKTTLLHALANCIDISEGKILYDNTHFFRRLFSEMTLVSNPAYMLAGSVTRNISYPLNLRKFSRREIDRYTSELISQFDLVPLADAPAKKLSAGEAQKVNLARALACSPKLLLLDEPTAQIDPSFVLDIEHILCGYAARTHATVLWVTHNLSQAQRIASHTLFIEKGESRYFGNTSEFFASIEKYYNIAAIKRDEFI